MKRFLRQLAKVFKDDSLTDNVKFNHAFSPIYFCIILYISYYHYGIPLFGTAQINGSLGLSFFSSFIYVFSSSYFQPDLDVSHSRPGMSHFPLGRWAYSWYSLKFLRWIFYPINRLWYHMWSPYAALLTHRGIGHLPIIGVWLRVLYLWPWVILLEWILVQVGLYHPNIRILEYWIWAFFPWDKNFLSLAFLLFCFPIYLSDTVHIAVDYYDSVKKGLNFCPPKIPRGLIVKTFNTIRGVDK